MKPENALLQAKLADALTKSGDIDEAEHIARAATQNAPNVWQPWAILGRITQGQAYRLLFPNLDKGSALPDPGSIVAGIQASSPFSEQLAKAERKVQEGQSYFDRAIAVAPKSADAYIAHVTSGIALAYVNAVKSLTANKAVLTQEVVAEAFKPIALAGVQKQAVHDCVMAARLSPDSPLTIAGAAMVVMAAQLITLDASVQNDPQGIWKYLSSSEQKDVTALNDLLEKIAQGNDRKRAAQAAKVRGVVQTTAHGAASAITDLQRAVALDPTDVQAQNYLDGLLLSLERYEEVVRVVTAQQSLRTTARHSLMLAKAYTKQSMFPWHKPK